MMKRMILAGMLAATAVPVLASTASEDISATKQSATTSAASKQSEATSAASKQSANASAASKTDGTKKHNCACCQKHHS